MPESKRRKRDDEGYRPQQEKGERKVAKIGSPGWLAPVMTACFVIGLGYIVVYYIAGQQIPVMSTIGGQLNALVNVAIGFGFIVVGFILATRWR